MSFFVIKITAEEKHRGLWSTYLNPSVPWQIRDVLTDNGNFNWTDDSPDGIHEPLLDVSNASVFDPKLILGESPLITLEATGYLVSGIQHTDLTWYGSTTSAEIDVYMDGTMVETTENDGFFTHVVGLKGKGLHGYRVCESPLQNVCSQVVQVTY